MTSSTPLTDAALSRLRAVAEGNGVATDFITFIDTSEQTHTVKGKLTITPHLSVKGHTILGRIKGKERKILPSFEELQAEVKALETSFKENNDWLDEALKELEKEEGRGWGHTNAQLTWATKTTTLAATENCPTCRGTAQRTCPECKGIGTLHCYHCEGRGRELCILCVGTGREPTNPQNRCPTCEGTKYSLCRFCRGTGRMPCPQCDHRGHMPCQECHGSGCISQEVQVKQAADINFALSSTADLPSGLLRMMSRIGDEGFCKGHADISIVPLTEDEKAQKDHIVITLEAKVPYADIKIRFGTRAVLVTCFGKKSRLSNVPTFLDDALKQQREDLKQAVSGQKPIQDCLQMRALRDALGLVLMGKTHANELRRHYSVGLSAQVAHEIMENMRIVLRRSTEQTRMLTAGLLVVGAMALFAGLFLTPIFEMMIGNQPFPIQLASLVSLPLLVCVGSWFGLLRSTQWRLKRLFPDTPIALTQSIGKTGLVALVLIVLVYLVVLYFSGYRF